MNFIKYTKSVQYLAGIWPKYWQSCMMISTGIHSFEYSLLLILTSTFAYHNDSIWRRYSASSIFTIH